MKHIALLLMVLGFFQIQGQNDKKSEIALEKKILKNAVTIGDPIVVTRSIYRIIALEGENSTYKDSLAYVYFSARQFAPCFMISSEVLKREPNHKEMLEMNAVSLESLGAYDKAAEVYKKLFPLSKINFHGYSLAQLQYSMKKYGEALKTIEKTEKLNDSGTYKVTFSINQNHNQKVELLAAIAYLKGLIQLKLDQKPSAKISLQNAIKIQPDFVLAKEQLDKL